tara:strand:- start:7034 stop:9514 length:2481 start_codon:yes stop_codon:yes gene_type:complete
MGIGSWFQRKKDQAVNVVKKVVDKTVDVAVGAVKGVFNIALSPFTGGFDIPDFNVDTTAAIDNTTTVDFTPSNTAIPVCYGKYVERAVKNIFVDTAGDKNQYLYMCGVIGLGMTQDDNYGSRLWNLLIDDQVCDIKTARAVKGYKPGNYTTVFEQGVSVNDTTFPGDGYPRFGGRQLFFGTTALRQPPTYEVKTGTFKNRVRFQLFDGSDSQPASDLLKESPRWNDDHRLRGVQYIALRFEWNNDEITDENGDNLTNPFSSLPRVVVMAPGKNVPKLVREKNADPGYEHDTDTTSTGVVATMPAPADYSVTFASGAYSHTATRQDGYDVSGNPVEILLDYMLNDRYGAGIPLSKIDQNSFINAAVACGRLRAENSTAGSNFATNNYQLIYEGVLSIKHFPNLRLRRNVGIDELGDGKLLYPNSVYYRQFVIDTGMTHLQNINRILTSMGGIMPFVNGKFKLTIENAGTPDNSYDIPSDSDLKASHTMTFNDDNIIDGISFNGGALENTFNQIKVNFTDIEERSQNNSVVWPPKTDAQYKLFRKEDNDQDLVGNVTNAGIVNAAHATHYAKVLVAKSRRQQSISFKTTESATDLTAGDLIRVTSTTLNFDHMFRITNMTMNQDGDIEITAIRHYPNNYDFDDVNLFDNMISFNRFVTNKLRKRPVINTVRNRFRQPQGLLVRSKATPGLVFSKTNRSDLLVTWKDGNINANNNQYEVQVKKNTDANAQFVSLGTTRNQEFTVTTEFFVAGQKLTIRVRAINQNGDRSSFASTSVSSKSYFGGEFEDNVFPFPKNYMDGAISTLSSGGGAGTTVTTPVTIKRNDTGEI